MLSDYTFFFTSGGSDIEVSPIIDDLVFEDREDRTFGIYRKFLLTEMVFKGADYTTLRAVETGGTVQSFPFLIKYKGTTKYNGFLKIGGAQIEWDVSNCCATARIDIDDDYTCLFNNWEDQINILSGTTKYELDVFAGVIECNDCVETPTGDPPDWPLSSPRKAEGCGYSTSAGWTVVKNDIQGVTQVSASPLLYEAQGNITTTYCREFYPTSAGTPPGDGWISVAGGSARLLVAEFDPGNSDLDPSDGVIIQRWAVPGYNVDTAEITMFDNAVLLKDVAEDFLPTPCSAYTVVSDFFGINASGDNPVNTPYAEASGNLQNVMIFQKSDVKFPEATQNAFAGNWTYKGFLEHLATMFNVEFRVSGSNFLLEHESFFSRPSGLNLTVAPYDDMIDGLHRYEIDETELSKQERWRFMETVSDDFEGVPITYADVGDEADDERVFGMPFANNDVAYIEANPEQIDDKGFVFVNAHESSGDYFFITETSELDASNKLNGHLSIPNLQNHYHKYGRLLPSGTMNNTLTAFDTTIKRKKQTELSIIYGRADYHDTFDPADQVKTQMGWGEVVRARYSAANCTLTLIIRHD